MSKHAGSLAFPKYSSLEMISQEVAPSVVQVLKTEEHDLFDAFKNAKKTGNLELVRQAVVQSTNELDKKILSCTPVNLHDYSKQPRFIDRSFLTNLSDNQQQSQPRSLLEQSAQFFEATFGVALESISHDLMSKNNLTDLTSFDQAAATVFIRRLEAMRSWLLMPDVTTRYNLNLMQIEDIHRKSNLVALKHAQGTLIHGVRAKDSKGKFALYHIHVPEKHTDAFIHAIDGEGMIDLETFGSVIFSQYEDVIHEKRMQEGDKELKAIVDRYAALTIRERTYAILNGDFALSVSKEKKYHEAYIDEIDENLSWLQRFSPQASEEFLKTALDKQFDLHEISFLVGFLTGKHSVDTTAILGSVNLLVRLSGGGKVGFERLETLIASDWHPANERDFERPFIKYKLRASVAMAKGASPSASLAAAAIAPFIPAGIGLIPFAVLGAAFAARQMLSGSAKNGDQSTYVNQSQFGQLNIKHGMVVEMQEDGSEMPLSHWSDIRNDLSLLSIISTIEPKIMELLCDYVINQENLSLNGHEIYRTIEQVIKVFVDDRTFHFELIEDDSFDKYGLTLSLNIKKLMSYIQFSDNIDEAFKNFCRDYTLYEFCSLVTFGHFIQEKDTDEKIKTLRALLEPSLTPAFDLADTSPVARAALLDEFCYKLLGLEIDQSTIINRPVLGKWTANATGIIDRVVLPDTAPATWKSNKLKGDTPPIFIKRHYGPPTVENPDALDVLRADGMGLTRPDIKQLDSSLYMGIRNWLRQNEWPSDCPLPTKSESVTAELDVYYEDEAAQNLLRLSRVKSKRDQQK